MANAIYDKARQKFLDPGTLGATSSDAIDWVGDNIKAVLVDTALYAFSQAHEFLSDVPVGARVATSGNLTAKTATNGVADADDVTFAAVSGASIEAIVLYKDTGTATTSPLIAYIDTGTGLPVTPSGGDIIVSWDNGANRIFRL